MKLNVCNIIICDDTATVV